MIPTKQYQMADPFVRTAVSSVFVNLLAKTTGKPCSPFLMSAAWTLRALAQDFRPRREHPNFYAPDEVPTILLIIVAMAMAKPF